MQDENSSAIEVQPDLRPPRYAMRGAGGSDLGLRHHINEDRHIVGSTATGGALLIVCDGMGGMGRGDQASALALSRLVDSLSRGHEHPFDAATHAIHQVDRELVSSFPSDKTGKRPGTTCAIVHVEAGFAYVTWVGDSLVLILRDGVIAAQSRPHRMVQDMIDSGAMSWEEARTSPMGRYLSRSLGGRSPDEPVVEPSMLAPWRLVGGDAILVCSDGLTDFLRNEEIAEIVARGEDEETTVQTLIGIARDRGVDDNVTVLIARCLDARGHDAAEQEHYLAAAWDYFASADEEEPDYHSDIRSNDLPQSVMRGAAQVSVFVVAGAVFGVGALLMLAVLSLVWLL